MTNSSASRMPARGASRWPVGLAAIVVTVAAIAAYYPSFFGVFVYDDEPAILLNPTLRHLGTALFPPADSAVSGRPVANLSFALNHALSGTQTWSYHALNLLIHVLAGLTLFGVIRRTLRQLERNGPVGSRAASVAEPVAQSPDDARAESHSTLLALAAALLWALHPLQTEAVTYIVQRVESLMALFYLLTLYCFIRSVERKSARRWRWLAVGVCLLGMATKEVMATAPIVLFLYDRTFVAGSFRRAWAERRMFYLALAATWLPLAGLVASTGWNRGGTAGFGVGVAPWAYWFTQFHAVARYVGLAAWPHPLIFDYPTFWARGAADVVPYAAVVVALLATTSWALWRRSPAGFLGASFFLVLAPTSVVPGTIQMIAEHRMYLPLAAVTTAAIVGTHRWLGNRGVVALLAAAAGLGCVTAHRNEVYHDRRSLWNDTLAKRPDSERAHNNLGTALVAAGDLDQAIAHFRAAVRLNPNYAEAHYNLGNALRSAGHPGEATAQYELALRANAKMPDALTALGELYLAAGRSEDGFRSFAQALQISPNYWPAHEQLGIALARAGQWPDALAHLEAALRLDPSDPDVHNNLGNALSAAGRTSEALAQYQQALALDPRSVEAHHNLANALRAAERLSEAIAEYQQALSIDPKLPMVRNDLGITLLLADRTQEAIAEFERALQADPNLGNVHLNLALALQSVGRNSDAAAHFEAARRLGVTPPAIPGP